VIPGDGLANGAEFFFNFSADGRNPDRIKLKYSGNVRATQTWNVEMRLLLAGSCISFEDTAWTNLLVFQKTDIP
jgi:hypothetical protein